MNASTRSTVASLGERPRRKSPQNFRSTVRSLTELRRRRHRAAIVAEGEGETRANGGRTGKEQLPERWSARRKAKVVLRLLHG